MKQVYADVAVRFLADHGGLFRCIRNRWWYLDDGYWYRENGRLELEKAIFNWMYGYAPEAQQALNAADMNDMCAFLNRALTSDRLPGKYIDADQDPRVFNRNPQPKINKT
jgi:hypothetical protein